MRVDIMEFIPKAPGRIISRELEDLTHLSGQDIRAEVNRLRFDGWPIASDCKGYYIATSAEEITATIKNLESRRNAMNKAIQGLREAQYKMVFEGKSE